MAKRVSKESCYGSVFSKISFNIGKNTYDIKASRDEKTPDGWWVHVSKNGKEIESRKKYTNGNIQTNKIMLTIRNSYLYPPKTTNK